MYPEYAKLMISKLYSRGLKLDAPNKRAFIKSEIHLLKLNSGCYWKFSKFKQYVEYIYIKKNRHRKRT